MYAMTCKRPHIVFAVEKLSRFTNNSGPMQWMTIQRRLKYLKGIKNHGICQRNFDPTYF